MRIKLAFSLELDQILGSLSDHIELVRKRLKDVPGCLEISSNLLKNEDQSAMYALKLLNKSKNSVSQADLSLSEIIAALENYISQTVGSQENSQVASPTPVELEHVPDQMDV